MKDLYEKVVPPVAAMEDFANEMRAENDKLAECVSNFDVNISLKASKQDLVDLENKFRQFVKKEKYKQFVEVTETDIVEMRAEVNGSLSKMEDIEKHIRRQVKESVKKNGKKLYEALKPDPNLAINSLLL